MLLHYREDEQLMCMPRRSRRSGGVWEMIPKQGAEPKKRSPCEEEPNEALHSNKHLDIDRTGRRTRSGRDHERRWRERRRAYGTLSEKLAVLAENAVAFGVGREGGCVRRGGSGLTTTGADRGGDGLAVGGEDRGENGLVAGGSM